MHPSYLVGTSPDDQNKVSDYQKNSLSTTGTVYVLGGASAVSDDMVSQVTAEGFAYITRLSGSDRYETSLKIASALDVKQGSPIVLVDGENYPDALSISSVAADMQYPIFLVNGDSYVSSIIKSKNRVDVDKQHLLCFLSLPSRYNAKFFRLFPLCE